MATICFNVTNHQKGHVIEFLKKYFEIFYVTNCLKCKIQKFTLG